MTGQSVAGIQVSLRDSLRLRLPALIALVTILGLGAVVWFAFREVSASHQRAGAARAQGAADQLAGVFEKLAVQSLAQVQAVAADQVVRRYVDNPSEAHAAEVRTRLATLQAEVPRRFEIWTRDQQRLLSVSLTGTGVNAGKEIAEGTAPTAPGLGPIVPLDDRLVFFDLVADIQPLESEPPRAGFLQVRTTMRISMPGQLGQLVGGDPVILLGNASGAGWTDLSHVVPPPPVANRARAVHEYTAATSERHLAASAPIAGTPWAVWVDYPLDAIIAPAGEFVTRIALFSLLVVVALAGMVALVTTRIARPLQTLTAAAAQIAAGNWSHRVPVSRRDEVGKLSSAFNQMAADIQTVNRTLTDANDRTEFALGAAHMGIGEVDVDDNRITSLHALGPVLQLAPDEVPRTIDAFVARIHPDDRASVRAAVGHALANRRDEVSATFRFTRPDDSMLWLDARARLFFDPEGRPLRALGVIIDITRRMALEEQLRQAQKLEGVGQLAGGVAHDFNNLLTAILGFAELLRESVPANDRQSGYVHEILQAGKRGAGLTRQLLAFSRRQVLEPTVVDLNNLIAETSGMLRRLIGEHIKLVTMLSPESPRVLADRSQLEQVIVNLTVNARDAMPQGGALTIETSRIELTESYVADRPVVRPGPYVLITVTDTGIGMSAETRKRLFEPFFTTKERGRGTGLGLATVYGIVAQSGGYVWAYSEEGRGTVFKIYLPPTDQLPQTVQPAALPERRRGTELVLIVEDDNTVRELSRRVLESVGYRVIDAANPEAAEVLFTSEVELLVTDVIMPGASGPDLYRTLVARKPALKVLFTSGYTADMIANHGRLAPDTAFLQKPFTPDALCQKVRKVLDV